MRKKFSVLSSCFFFTAYAKNVIQKNFSNTFSQKNAEKTTTFRYLKLKASLYQLPPRFSTTWRGILSIFQQKQFSNIFAFLTREKSFFFFKLWHFKVVLSTLTQICSSLNVIQKWVILIYESYRYITTMKMHWNIANVMLCKDFAKNSTQ